MADLKKFMHANQLKQVDIARFLEISEASVSRVIKGFGKLAPENLAKLLDNNRGWDTSALTEDSDAVQIVGDNNSGKVTQTMNACPSAQELMKKIAELEAQLAGKEQENSWLRSLVEKLLEIEKKLKKD